LPERVHEDRHTRSSARIQETDAEDFSRLQRLGGKAKRKEQGARNKRKAFDDDSPLMFNLCHLITLSA